MRKTLLIILFVLAGASHAGAYALDERDPHTIIDETAGTILQLLNTRRSEFTEHPERLREMVRDDLLPLLDLEYSARLILGRSGRGISPEQLNAFSEAMSYVLTNRYADGLLQFKSGKQMEIMPMRGTNTEKLTRVRTRVMLTNGGYAPVDYVFRKTENGWKAFDVTVEGISYIITFRNQIGPRVKADGIDKVTDDLIAGTLSIHD